MLVLTKPHLWRDIRVISYCRESFACPTYAIVNTITKIYCAIYLIIKKIRNCPAVDVGPGRLYRYRWANYLLCPLPWQRGPLSHVIGRFCGVSLKGPLSESRTCETQELICHLKKQLVFKYR